MIYVLCATLIIILWSKLLIGKNLRYLQPKMEVMLFYFLFPEAPKELVLMVDLMDGLKFVRFVQPVLSLVEDDHQI